MTEGCPFCRPEIAASTFFSTDACLGIVNIAPIVPGHSLVLPRQHVERLLDLPPETYAALFDAVRRVTAIVMAVYAASAVDISIQDGVEAGQTVDHMHVHVIPRRANDLPSPGAWYSRLIDSHRRRPRTPQECAAEAAFVRQRRQELGL